MLPYEMGGGGRKVVAMLKRRHRKFWGSFYAVVLNFNHIEGGRKKFPLFKRGGARSFTLS